MNLASCKECGIVIDLDKVKFIEMEMPDDPDDEKLRDEDGCFDFEVDTSYNPDCIWPRDACSPLDTWQCSVCNEFNGKGESD
jgi:hypothetical protein